MVSHFSVKNALRALAFASITAMATPMAYADKDPVYTGAFSNTAVGGYDAVSFFSGEPVKGDKAFTTSYEGAEFRFTSQENLNAFLADPAAFAPQYGGYCAWAVAQGKTAKGDPKHWRIVEDKLYLNYNAKVQRDWEEDIPGFITQANANWPSILED